MGAELAKGARRRIDGATHESVPFGESTIVLEQRTRVVMDRSSREQIITGVATIVKVSYKLKLPSKRVKKVRLCRKSALAASSTPAAAGPSGGGRLARCIP